MMVLKSHRSISAAQLRHLQELSGDTAELFSAVPKRAAVVLRLELIRLVEAFQIVPRMVGLSADYTFSPELRRIGEGIAGILRATPKQEHTVIWAFFAKAVHDRQARNEDAAEWAIALRQQV
jgi:hypothetical protein